MKCSLQRLGQLVDTPVEALLDVGIVEPLQNALDVNASGEVQLRVNVVEKLLARVPVTRGKPQKGGM